MSIIMGWYVLNLIWILKERKIETNPKKQSVDGVISSDRTSRKSIALAR